MPGLLYATPTAGHPKPRYVSSMRILELTCRSFGERGISDYLTACAPVQMARSRIAEAAVNGKYEFCFMHDDDVFVGPNYPVKDPSDGWVAHGNPLDAWHAIMNEHPDVGVIGGVYMREEPFMPNVAIPHPVYPEELCHAVAGFPDRPVEVGAIGTGFMLVRVEVFRRLFDLEDADGAPPMFRFPLTPTRWGTLSETGEDYDFCRRVRAAGFRVLADPRYQTVHHKDSGPLAWNRAAWEARWAGDAAEASAKKLAASLSPKLRLAEMGGFLAIDHIGQREADAAAWSDRQRKVAA